MSDDTSDDGIKSPLEEQSLEKWKAVLDTPQARMDAMEKAFDYRGDITVSLASGQQVVGYIFNRNADASEPYIELIPSDKNDRMKILYKDVAGLFFSGKDTAAGKSWETFMARHKAKQEAAAQAAKKEF